MLETYDHLSLPYVLSVPSDARPSEPRPLVIVLHGRGADMNDLADIAPLLDRGGYRFVFPNAPHAFEAAPGMIFGRSWFDGWPPTRSSMDDARARLLQFIDEIAGRLQTPAGKIILSGFSQGGVMSFDAAFRTKQQIAGIVSMSGAIFENEVPAPVTWPKVPVLIVHGTADDMIPVLAARRARRFLESNGIEPEYHEFPMGHHVTPESLDVVATFMEKVLGGS